jgi:hypothetical protein
MSSIQPGLYQIGGQIQVDSPTADDVKFFPTFSGTATGFVCIHSSTFSRGVDLEVTSDRVATAGFPETLMLSGYLSVTVAGNLTIQLAKQDDSAGTSTTVYQTGTIITLMRVD